MLSHVQSSSGSTVSHTATLKHTACNAEVSTVKVLAAAHRRDIRASPLSAVARLPYINAGTGEHLHFTAQRLTVK